MQTVTYIIGQLAKVEVCRGIPAEVTVKGLTDTSKDSAAHCRF